VTHMKCLLLLLVLLLSACASLQPADGDAARLQEQIRSGEAIAVGDRIRITTRTGAERGIVVSAVDDGYVHGYEESPEYDELPQTAPGDDAPVIDIAIEDIVHVEAAQAEAGASGGDLKDALFLFAIGVGMVIAAFANF
jgi:hypothetical protein